jgi:hypothetical protein
MSRPGWPEGCRCVISDGVRVSLGGPCPACGIPWGLLPIGHDLIAPMDGSPQSCEVLPEPDPGIVDRWLTADWEE